MIWKAPRIKPSRNLIASTSPVPPCVAVCRTGNAGGLECVRLLAQAGANVNAHDNEGNTPLHGTFLTDVEEELLKLGEDVNARNELMGMWRYEPAATSCNERLVRILSKNHFANHWALPIWVSSWL
jgi:ankyrin repeat protein